MEFLKPKLSAELEAELNRAEAMHDLIQNLIPDRFLADSDERILVAGLFSLVIEHQDAILYLIRAGGRFDGMPPRLYAQ